MLCMASRGAHILLDVYHQAFNVVHHHHHHHCPDQHFLFAGWKGKPLFRPKPEHNSGGYDYDPGHVQPETEPDVCKICYDREINCVFLYLFLLVPIIALAPAL
jgi:hypothetical protein